MGKQVMGIFGLFSATAPVIGLLSGELFTGTAVGYLDRTGTIEMVSAVNPGLRCVGNFRHTGSKIGEGKLRCSDGNEASFQFNALTILSGYGSGASDKGEFSFTFGLTPEESTRYLSVPPGKRLEKDASGKAVLLPL